jgi:hypothetical protein
MVYGEVIGNLYTWAFTLENDIRTNSINEILTQTLMECKILSIALTKTSELFGYQLFLLTIIILVNLVLVIYRSVAFFIGTMPEDWMYWTIAVGYFGFGALSLDILGYITILAQEVIDGVQKLKDAIMDLNIMDDGKIAIIDGKIQPAMHARMQVLHQLNAFQGFNANGYFNVEKPLLTGVSANFATYLIVLIQFKMTEVSSTTKVECSG